MNWFQILGFVVSLAFLGQSLPMVNETKTSDDTQPTGKERQSKSASLDLPGAPRQLEALAALTPLLVPLAASLLGPVATAGGSGLSNVFSSIIGMNRSSLAYDAYMVNLPGVSGPHLYLVPHAEATNNANVGKINLPYEATPNEFGFQRPELIAPGFYQPYKQLPQYYENDDSDET